MIDPHRHEHGVEPSCKALPMAPSTCRRCQALEQPDKRSERARRGITTLAYEAVHKPLDCVQRQFKAARPNPLWVADITHVPTWSGLVCVAFVVDAYARYIVGWRVLKPMQTNLILDAFEALW